MGKIVAGALLALVALFMLLGFFNVQTPMSAPVAALTFLIAVLFPAAGAASLFYLHFRGSRMATARRSALRLQTHKAEILQLAMSKGGKLTVVEAVAATGLDHADAEAALRALVEDGVADIEVTNSGLLVYAFHDVQSLPEKGSGKGILEP